MPGSIKSLEMREFNRPAEPFILFPLITSASATFNERGALDDSSTLPQLVRDSRIAETEVKKEEGGGGGGTEEKEEDRAARITHRRSLAPLRRCLSVVPGCLLDDDPRRGNRGRGRARIAGSEVERCSIDSCHEAASPLALRGGEILSPFARVPYLFAFSRIGSRDVCR